MFDLTTLKTYVKGTTRYLRTRFVDSVDVANDMRTLATAISTTKFSNIIVVSADYTASATSDHVILVDASSGAKTITLPAVAVAAGIDLIVKKIDSTSNTVTVKAAGTELIDANNTYVITTQWNCVKVKDSGTAWFILSKI